MTQLAESADLGALTEVGAGTASATKTDARPVLPASTRSLWDEAAKQRDDIAALIVSEFAKRNVVAWVRKSKPGEYPLYVVVDSWIRVSESDRDVTIDKSALQIRISVEQYRKQPLTYSVELKRHAQEFSESNWDLNEQHVVEFVHYLLEGGAKPSFFESRVPLLIRLLGLVLPFIGNRPKNELVSEARSNYLTAPVFLGIGGPIAAMLLALAIGDSDPDSSNAGWYVFCALAGVTSLVVASVIAGRRPIMETIPKQPLRTPRREFRFDSWHVSVPEGGKEFARFRDRLHAAVAPKGSGIDMNIEVHQNLTPRGFEERERLVLSKGQTTLHIHVYPFSDDAFVGWESYLNWNRWAEGEPVSSTVRDGKKINYRPLTVGVHVPNDFDLIEADVLAETTHRQLVSEIKNFLKEREIEADLDFKIIRGDRSTALKEGNDQEHNRASSPRVGYRMT